MDWFFGFTLHLVVNDQGELVNFTLTPGNTDDRTPVPKLLQQIFGKVFADKGYVSQKLAKQLWQQTGVQLITKLRRTMKNPLLLRKGSIIETIIAQLKNISPIEHSCHPSPVNFLVNLVGGITCLLPPTEKPPLRLTQTCSPRLIHNGRYSYQQHQDWACRDIWREDAI